jgi:hypothetical protein
MEKLALRLMAVYRPLVTVMRNALKLVLVTSVVIATRDGKEVVVLIL